MKRKIETIQNHISIDIEMFLKTYNYQSELTANLDDFQGLFDQAKINEVVLWKVNRYAKFSETTLQKLNNLPVDKIDRELTDELLRLLLNTKGVKLAMASTILRFKNPNLFQILDQRVYRIIYGEQFPKTTKINEIIRHYFSYLEELRKVCKEKKIPFELSDRILYELDKKINKGINLIL
jgi:thermostable 8-oxoguanine DNA glycosylase